MVIYRPVRSDRLERRDGLEATGVEITSQKDCLYMKDQFVIKPESLVCPSLSPTRRRFRLSTRGLHGNPNMSTPHSAPFRLSLGPFPFLTTTSLQDLELNGRQTTQSYRFTPDLRS